VLTAAGRQRLPKLLLPAPPVLRFAEAAAPNFPYLSTAVTRGRDQSGSKLRWVCGDAIICGDAINRAE